MRKKQNFLVIIMMLLPLGLYGAKGCNEAFAVQIGSTFYEMQTSGSTGSRITVHDYGIHTCWLGVADMNRFASYNFVSLNGSPGWEEGIMLEEGSSFPQMAHTSDGKAIITYFNRNDITISLGIDAACGYGLFTFMQVPNEFPGSDYTAWPYITYDHQEYIHVISTSTSDVALTGHTISQNGGETWTDLTAVDSAGGLSSIVVSSPVDDKVAIVYTKPRNYTELNMFDTDVVYVESADGVNWNYSDFTNITNYEDTDTLRAFYDLDALYDNDGELHIIWVAHGFQEGGGRITTDSCLVFHWSENTGISLVYNAWHASYPGMWNMSAAKVSLAVNEDGNLYALWSHYNDEDIAVSGLSNAELYLTVSNDNGLTWADPVNITNTPSPDCVPGDCFSEVWPSMAEFADDSVYITYIEDKFPTSSHESDVENPVIFTKAYCVPTSVDSDENVPSLFNLDQNYPNPFNSATNIDFVLEENAHARLEVFNILGQKAETLLDKRVERGEHTITWSASNYSSGIYFYKLSVQGQSEVRRMVYLK